MWRRRSKGDIIYYRYIYAKITISMSTAEIAQLGERQTEDLKVPGSKPESSYELWTIPGLGSLFYFFFSSEIRNKLNQWQHL